MSDTTGQPDAIPTKKLLADFRNRDPAPDQGELLHFGGVGDRDVYNITTPFSFDGKTFIAERADLRQTAGSLYNFYQWRTGYRQCRILRRIARS